MNGALLDSTFGIFFKLRYDKVYDGALATPLRPVDIAWGELTWSLLRASVYSLGFLGVMAGLGLVTSWWALLAWPATWLVGFAFAGAGMALTTYMKSWQDFEYVTLVTLPMFLFSATFYPITVYPPWVQTIIELFPLWHGVELVRGLTTGALQPAMWLHLGYFLVLIAFGLVLTTRRLRILFLA
jgi:lipooligosaccharide transport system permease protein